MLTLKGGQMFEDIFIRALVGAIGVAIVAGPLGCFVVWRRMAYFGDSLAHSALLGVALGMVLGLGINLGIVLVCALFSVGLVFLERQRRLSSDAALGIFAHGALATGLVVIGISGGPQVDLMSFLVGDVLAISVRDLVWIFLGGVIVLAGVVWLWRPLLSVTVNEDLAQAEGVNVFFVRLCFMGLMAIFVAVAIKIVGVLLITSLLIIPAATARGVAHTPLQMALVASAVGVAAVLFGLYGSMLVDAPAGPAIVVAAVLVFILSQLRPNLGQ